MVKLKDLFNKKVNKRNNQESLDVKKKVFKENNLKVEDILDIDIKPKEKFEW